MRGQEPTTRTIELADVAGRLDHLIKEASDEETRVLIERLGVPVAAIVPIKDFEHLQRFERERAERFAVIDRMREAFKDVPPEQIERDVAAVITEVRAEDEAESGAGVQAMVERQPA